MKKNIFERLVSAVSEEFKEELEELTRRYVPSSPVRLCAECFEAERKENGRKPYYYRFDDDGTCHRCSKDVTAGESTGVESVQ